MSLLVKRSVTLSGHDTSLALEPEFWSVLDAMARFEDVSLARLIRRIDEGRGDRPLASACRVAALAHAGHPPSRPEDQRAAASVRSTHSAK